MQKITTKSIHEAAQKIVESGGRPTLAAVREALGGGSFTTISEALKTWKKQVEEESELSFVDVPQSIRERSESLASAIWKDAMSESEKRLSAERDALATAQAAFEEEIAEAREAVKTLEIEAHHAQMEIERLSEIAEKNEERIRNMNLERASFEAEKAAIITGLEQRISDSQTSFDKLVAKLD